MQALPRGYFPPILSGRKLAGRVISPTHHARLLFVLHAIGFTTLDFKTSLPACTADFVNLDEKVSRAAFLVASLQ